MNDKNLRWHNFIEDICLRDMTTLSDIQRKAILVFWYDAYMGSNGYREYITYNPNANSAELKEAILTVGYKDIADNYQKAFDNKSDNWVETDVAYFKFSPSLYDCLRKFVEENKDAIFD